MRYFIVVFILIQLFFSCSHDNTVQISGRIENGDTIVYLWVEDSVYKFPLDENHFFSGKVHLKSSGYAILDNSLNLYLSPGENLEIYTNALNYSASLNFRGSLGGINSYLKEQEVAVFFDKDDYSLDEEAYVKKMKGLIDEKTKLLEVKNFDEVFTKLEKERIRYSVAKRAVFYPFYRKNSLGDVDYQPGKTFTDFITSFSLNNENLLSTNDYQAFLLNYVYLQGSLGKKQGRSYSDEVADYIVSSVTNPVIKDFLLTQIVSSYIWDNNGLEGAEYLLTVYRRECTDKSKVAYMEETIEHWEKLAPGRPAPEFQVKDREDNIISLADYRGSYLYIAVWATWCVPCKNELPYFDLLQKEYENKNLKFLTVAVDDPKNKQQWKNFLEEHHYSGVHSLVGLGGKFTENYMIISVPRFILIDPDGKIVTSNAPRPSGQIHQLLDSLKL